LRIFLIFLHRHERPSKGVRVEHVDIHRSAYSVILTGTVASKRVNILANRNRRMINSSWSWGREICVLTLHAKLSLSSVGICESLRCV
jgi:hypothetical protein